MIGLVLTYLLLQDKSAIRKQGIFWSLSFAFMMLSAFSYSLWARQWAVPDISTSFLSRFLESETYLRRLPQVFAYFLDVFFRPLYWGILWPIGIWALWQTRKQLRWALLPLALMIFFIPLLFIRFPDGAYREVVLTGSNRALWQLLPILWLLLSHAYPQLARNKS